jgi:carbamoyltransferase
MSAPIYILGTGLSHDGSAILLKDGAVCIGIEKERVTRKKHDGGNDTAAIQYCLDAAGITLADVSLVVQCANFETPDRERFHGARLFAGTEHPPLITISHHLAHAYSAAGTCNFSDGHILVIDGAGSPFDQCIDVQHGTLSPEGLSELSQQKLWCEKDSFYHFDGQRLSTLYKDFSEFEPPTNASFSLQTTKHSIGGFYASVSQYVFGNLDDVGKLMGLAPFGRSGQFTMPAFDFTDGRIFVRADWQQQLDRPAQSPEDFKQHFQYYADIACWAQECVEWAVSSCFADRLSRFPHVNVCFSGGVALNAVANARLLNQGIVENLYLEPAAGDNGLALGCAFYGWLETLAKPKVPHNGNTCFGKSYTHAGITAGLAQTAHNYAMRTIENDETLVHETARLLAEGKTIGWFQGGSEFGPRALGHRSILAHPGIPGLRDHINANIKFREDFRPFAPAVLPDLAPNYFVSGRPSPYMILVDETKPEHRDLLQNVTHVNGTARVQTVDKTWNPRFAALLEQFHALTGIGVLLNTSFNRKGMPMVERPEEAFALFAESALDVLVLENVLLEKTKQADGSPIQPLVHATDLP